MADIPTRKKLLIEMVFISRENAFTGALVAQAVNPATPFGSPLALEMPDVGVLPER